MPERCSPVCRSLPRSPERGPMAAPLKHRSIVGDGEVSRGFRARPSAAPLKQVRAGRDVHGVVAFRARPSAAPLKHDDRGKGGGEHGHFRARPSAAPLKQSKVALFYSCLWLPRSPERGPIEATALHLSTGTLLTSALARARPH